MAKKKHNKHKSPKDASLGDTSEEEINNVNIQGKNCPHVGRGINFGHVKKSLKSPQNITSCNGCSNENSSDLEELPEVWLCLQCGHRGCGRVSEKQHGLQHFKTLHSDCHSLVLSTTSGSVWCYDCDDAISLQASRALKQCVEFVMKMLPNSVSVSEFQNVNKLVSQSSLQTSVIKEETTAQNTEDIISKEKSRTFPKSVKESSQKIPVKGLKNLGNTCFFNAVMQNLNQTPLLYYELKTTCTPTHLWEVPELDFVNNEVIESDNLNKIKLSLPRQFPLTNSLLNFFEQMSETTSAKVDIINPSPLFGELSKKCPQFRHFQQQDSHELLRQLLDGVRQEEIKRQKKAILRHFDLENISPENVDEEMKKQIKAYGCHASHTIVEKVFGGLLISTVLCEECKVSSQVFEPFMDLSLPLFEEKQQENNEHLYGMLDGGKQAHTKPLRNKKVDCDSDENADGEYSLSKSKNDPAKPSKHQEKKLKQLAKKEKKKIRTTAKNRKKNVGENFGDSVDNQLNKPNGDVNGDKEEKDDNEVENGDEEIEKQDEESSVDHDDEEVWEVKELFDSDGEDSKNGAEIPSQQSSPIASNDVDVQRQNVDISADFVGLKIDEKDATPIVFPLPCSEASQSSCVVQKEFLEEMNEVEKTGESVEKEADKNSATTANEKRDEPSENMEKTEEVSHQNNQNQMAEMADSNEQEERTDVIAEITPKIDASFNNLKQEAKSPDKITASDDVDIGERIQALSLQVTDVRIRRDSDRQENILNSSESADDTESLHTNCTSPKSSIEESSGFENTESWTHSYSEEQMKNWISKTLTTLKPRIHASPLECSVNSCLSHFTKPELLTGSNKFRCENCTNMKVKKTGNKKDVVYTNASKQLLIFSPPAVLTLHLKRFQQVGMSLRKVNRFVEFPLFLDLAPFCCSACSLLPNMASVGEEILYSLYGIVEHAGRLSGGHYTAYVKSNTRTINRIFECELPLAQCDLNKLLRRFSGVKRDLSENTYDKDKEDARWFYISDSFVKEVSEAQVLKCQAYLLFYERI